MEGRKGGEGQTGKERVGEGREEEEEERKRKGEEEEEKERKKSLKGVCVWL